MMTGIKRITVLFLVFGFGLTSWAGVHQAELGIYGGASWWLTNSGIVNTPGVAYGISVGYAVHGSVSYATELGIKTGISFGFASASHTLFDYREQYTNLDYYPEQVEYTISADKYRQHQQQWQAMIPLFLSLKTHDIVVNIGPKAMCLVSQTRQLDVTNAHIVAYYPDFDVPIVDYLATGRLAGFKDHQTGKSTMPQWSVALSCEIGYEWRLTNQSHIGVAAYADYDIWNTYRNRPLAHRLIDVAPILNRDYPVPDIGVNYLTDTYTNKVHFLSFGVRAYYAFTAKSTKWKKNQPCRCLNNYDISM